MTNDLVALIEFYEKEKSIEREKVVEALENAFLSAYRRMVPGAEDIEELRAEVDTKKGETRIFASLKVVADTYLTTYDVLDCKTLLLSQVALEKLEERLTP